MSQSNNNLPSISFEGPYYGSQLSQTNRNASFSQWSSQGQRPSPSPSARTAWSVPESRVVNTMNPNQPNTFSRNNRNDPAFPNLPLMPPGIRPRSVMDTMGNANPIARFYSEDAPWSSESMRSRNVPLAGASFPQPMTYGPYRDRAPSEFESVAQKSDSGYQTLPSQSVMSNEPVCVDQELPSEVTFPFENINVSSAVSEPTQMFHGAGSVTDVASLSGHSTTRSRTQGKTVKCMQCKDVFKCRSDFKKHMLRHDKPYRCNIPNCRRGGKGFTTTNDLERHRKSVHRIGVTKDSWQCAAEHCRNKEKIWPRLDNFKQHINRMHKDEDERDLIRRSVYHAPAAPSPATESMSVDPMDTTLTLAGIGTEKQFSNSSNALDDPTSGISLTPDQESSQWNYSNPSAREFTMDVDQTNARSLGQTGKTNQGLAGPFQTQSTEQDASTTFTTPPRSGSLQRLSTLADMATLGPSLDHTVQERAPQLSNAPQTKADQQKHALLKFSKILVRDIQNASSSAPGDLESVITRALSTFVRKAPPHSRQPSNQSFAHGPSTTEDPLDDAAADTLTKKEALTATQAMSNLIKKAATVRPRPSGYPTANMRKCEQCLVTVARPCDMRKHMKRHTRPYGCTYPNCHKTFGAKSDWKRHENSQHFQLESFRCQLPSPSVQDICGELFYRDTLFKTHLKEEHDLSSDLIEKEVKLRKIGKNGQGQFWCGFCEDIVKLEKKRNAAWDERFDHIDGHFNKEGKRIEEWLCVEARKTKGEVRREVDRNLFDEEDGEGLSPEDDLSTSQELQPITREASQEIASSSQTRKRVADPTPLAFVRPEKRHRRETVRFCCECGGGPCASHTHVQCVDCQHYWCNNCLQEVTEVWGN